MLSSGLDVTLLEPCGKPLTQALESYQTPIRLSFEVRVPQIPVKNLTLTLCLAFYTSHYLGTSMISDVPTGPNSGFVTSFLFDGSTPYSKGTLVFFIFWVPAQTLMMTFSHFHINCGDKDALEVAAANGDLRRHSPFAI